MPITWRVTRRPARERRRAGTVRRRRDRVVLTVTVPVDAIDPEVEVGAVTAVTGCVGVDELLVEGAPTAADVVDGAPGALAGVGCAARGAGCGFGAPGDAEAGDAEAASVGTADTVMAAIAAIKNLPHILLMSTPDQPRTTAVEDLAVAGFACNHAANYNFVADDLCTSAGEATSRREEPSRRLTRRRRGRR